MKNDQLKYTDDQFLQDFGRTAPWAIDGLRSHGVLRKCSACGIDVTTGGYNLALSDGVHTGIHAVCGDCFDNSPVQTILGREQAVPDNYILVPEAAEQRRDFMRELVLLAAERVAKEYGLPIVRRPLFCDGLQHPAVGFFYSKLADGMGTAEAIVPWKDDDPLFLVGRVARDAERIRESILKGESTVTLMRGGGVLMTADEKLIVAMSTDVGGADHV